MSNFSDPLIYAVDDDDDDRYLLQRIFAEHFKECNLRVFENGSTLLTHLTHQLDGRLPDLIILDLEMPIFSGFDILRFLKCNEEFRRIPTSILSALHHKEHIERCYELGTNGYLDKTQSYIELVASIQHLQRHWLEAHTFDGRVQKKPANLQKMFDFMRISLN